MLILYKERSVKMIKRRDIVTSIILSIITCGIYGIFWFISITDDARVVSGDDRLSGGKCFLLTLITCGIYGFYWAYLMGKAMMQAKAKNDMPADDNAMLYVILQIFGLGIVIYCLVQSDLNTIADKGNTTVNA